MAKKNQLFQSVVIIGVIAFVILSVRGDGLLDFSSTDLYDYGYPSGFEGPKATFYGINYDDKHYTTFQEYEADPCNFDTYLRFDADGNDPYYASKLNIMGEESGIFCPKESEDNAFWWVPSSWITEPEEDPNPEQVYEWVVDDKIFRMEKWDMYLYVTLDAEYDGMEKPLDAVSLINPNVYLNAEVWVEIDLTPVQYFEGQDVVYFAIGKVSMMDDVERRCKIDGDIGKSTYSDESPRNEMSVHPESVLTPAFIYNEPWGDSPRAERDPSDFEGFLLNPTYFEDKVYFHIALNNFGAEGWNDFLWLTHVKCDSATFWFKVTTFVVGEWKVQDIEVPPEMYGRFTQSYSDLGNLLALFMDFLFSPFGLIMIVILIIVLFPEALTIFTGKKKSSTTNTLLIIVAIVVFLIFILPWLLKTLGVTG